MLFLIDSPAKRATALSAGSFADIGVRERFDLQEWVIATPALLGEELLVVTSEYDRFDFTDERLDVLALDRRGKLVIVELKRTAANTTADLQAIRYAAFCSNFTLADIAELHQQHLERRSGERLDIETVRDRITTFVADPDFDELDNKPRIILAAQEFPREITSTVLWLRGFDVDISCIRLEPHVLDGKLVIESSLLIPLPETKDFVIRRDRKEAERADADSRRSYSFEQFLASAPAEARPLMLVLRAWLLERPGTRETAFRRTVTYRQGEDNAWVTYLQFVRGALGVALPPEGSLDEALILKTEVDGWQLMRVTTQDDVVEAKRLLSRDYGIRHLSLSSSARGEAYRGFFQPLIDTLRENHDFTNARAAQPQNWYTFKSGLRGIGWSAVLAGDGRLGASVYIDVGEKVENKRVFDALYAQRQALQTHLTDPLVWERLNDRQASRVSVYRDASIDDDAETLARAREWLVRQLLALRDAFEPAVRPLLGQGAP